VILLGFVIGSTEEAILAQPARLLTQAQREFYFENGYLLLKSVIGNDWLTRLKSAIAEVVDRSREMTVPDDVIWLEKGHTRSDPRLLRLNCPDVHHPGFWAYATESILSDIAADLVGPDVRYSHSLLNFKWAEVGQEVK
tara:strand:- start:152 stop:568 length:417 start_codon:yes stop_codon:yes gene_type:complete